MNMHTAIKDAPAATQAQRLVFRNRGLIDLTAVRTLGVSVKEEGAIGYFGTGLKFAIATVLRGGGSIIIWRGLDRHEFGVASATVRDKQFDVVTLDGAELGFTTQLGRDWKPWMAFRELACNALDEGGSYGICRNAHHGIDGETIIEVIGAGMVDAYHDRHDIILEAAPIYANEFFEIHPGPSSQIYYRGVRVGETMRPCSFRYNLLKQIDLTEDRTFKYQFQVMDGIERGLLACDDLELLNSALTCGNDYYEHFAQFSDNGMASPAFLRVAAELRANLDKINVANPSAMSLARQRKLSMLGPSESVILNQIEQERFDRACGFLVRAGYDLNAYPIIIVEDLGFGVYGLAKEDKIFIAKAAFQKGTKEVASTLLEEFVHLKTGYADETRQLQTWLFDELLSQAERASGVAL